MKGLRGYTMTTLEELKRAYREAREGPRETPRMPSTSVPPTRLLIPEPDWEALGIRFPLDLRELPWACARLEQAGYDAWVEDDGRQLVLRYRLNTQTKGGER